MDTSIQSRSKYSSDSPDPDQEWPASPPIDPQHAARLAAGRACYDAAQAYLALGLSVTWCCDPEHIAVGKKHGERCDTPGKTPMHLWKALQSHLPTAAEVQQQWERYPLGNVGCALGQVSGLVRVDEDGPEGEALLHAWSAGDLPPTWAFRSSAAGRGLLYAWPRDLPCQTTTEPKKGRHQELRLMANGSQTILPPSRHASGSLYTWEPGQSPTEIDLAPAPAWLVARLRVSPRPTSTPLSSQASETDPFRTEDIQRVQTALTVIDSDPHETWLKIGMALHSTEWPEAYNLWNVWSQGSSKYNEDIQATKWGLFKTDGGVGLGSLFYLARTQGWRATPPLRQRGPVPGPEPAAFLEEAYPYSDAYNAQELLRAYGTKLRYVPAWKTWLIWTGTHWQRDHHHQALRWQRQTVKALGKHLESTQDDTAAKALLAHIKSSLSTARLKAALEQAQSWEGVSVDAEACDANPWLLNCRNGTLELRFPGTLRPHNPNDLLTKCLAIDYDADATCKTWDTFLWRIMGGTITSPDTPDMSTNELEERAKADTRPRALIEFLARIVGYSLTGSTREQCLFILYGVTKTGKSTFLSTLRALLGPYSQQANMATFMKKDRDSINNDIADLVGSRLVCASESKENQKLAEALVKEMTGGSDLLKARFLFQEYFSYKPQFKIFLGTNHKPIIKDTDGAIWERIRLVPFAVQIPPAERDKNLDEALLTELPGILAWAVRGCREWQAKKELHEPKAVIEATAGYRAEQDVLGNFLQESCTVAVKSAKVKSSVLYKAYQAWCPAKDDTLTQKAFSQRLENKGYICEHTMYGNFWQGIGLLQEA